MQRHEAAGTDETDPDRTIEILEEDVDLSKREFVSGRVRVQTVTHVVTELVEETLDETKVEILRVPVGRMVAEIPAVRTEDGVTIMPIVEEVLVVEKRLRLKEELHIRQIRTSQAVEVPVELRKQDAVVERIDLRSERTPDPQPKRSEKE